MTQPTKPDEQPEPETFEERVQRLQRQKVKPEDEDRKSPGGPGAQVNSDIEPAGS